MADLTVKKFLDQAGTTYLWRKIAAELEKKGAVASVTANDDSVLVSGTAADPKASNFKTERYRRPSRSAVSCFVERVIRMPRSYLFYSPSSSSSSSRT